MNTNPVKRMLDHKETIDAACEYYLEAKRSGLDMTIVEVSMRFSLNSIELAHELQKRAA